MLIDGSDLNDSIIVAGQSLLAKQFLHINGFQYTILINGLKFLPIEEDGVQILHAGKRLGSILRVKVVHNELPPPIPKRKNLSDCILDQFLVS